LQLLQFELANKDWFEQHIAPRAAEFYTLEGVQQHIQQYLDGYANGCWHPCVILDEHGHIMGRANLKDIDRQRGSAETGYRIARSAAGRGIATSALHHLIMLARQQWQLRQLQAWVAPTNTASARVLRKCGFVHIAQYNPRTSSATAPALDHQFILTLA
jgi:ribosomal-protein-alanine N-acetyltransferase